LITIGEHERTHALHDETLYPTTPSAAPDTSARASVGAPQVAPRLVLYLCMEGKVVIIGKCVFDCVDVWVLCMWCLLIHEYVIMYDGYGCLWDYFMCV